MSGVQKETERIHQGIVEGLWFIDALANRDEEIQRLRDAAVIARTTEANLHEEIERLRQETLVQSEYIETVQKLLEPIIERLKNE